MTVKEFMDGRNSGSIPRPSPECDSWLFEVQFPDKKEYVCIAHLKSTRDLMGYPIEFLNYEVTRTEIPLSELTKQKQPTK